MYYHNINFIAVLVAAVASFLIGWLWYSPVLFANAWMKALGKTREDLMKGGRQRMISAMLTSFIQAIIVATAIAHFINIAPEVRTVGMAIETALICWFAFVGAIGMVQRTYEQSNLTLFYLTLGYRFFEFIVIALIVYFIH
jgi:hypothetical protein